MGGWSSNSKWSLLGGMRSAAQIISYELPASVALLTVATLDRLALDAGASSTRRAAAPWQWYLFHNPFTFVAFFIWFISALAEGNRTPFDLPEAESELVAGYNTEYSGFRFSLFPLVEWVNLFVIGAVATHAVPRRLAHPRSSRRSRSRRTGGSTLVGFGVFIVKDVAIIFVIIWIRWTLPRFRVDQMMNLCWKYFIPISFVLLRRRRWRARGWCRRWLDPIVAVHPCSPSSASASAAGSSSRVRVQPRALPATSCSTTQLGPAIASTQAVAQARLLRQHRRRPRGPPPRAWRSRFAQMLAPPDHRAVSRSHRRPGRRLAARALPRLPRGRHGHLHRLQGVRARLPDRRDRHRPREARRRSAA